MYLKRLEQTSYFDEKPSPKAVWSTPLGKLKGLQRRKINYSEDCLAKNKRQNATGGIEEQKRRDRLFIVAPQDGTATPGPRDPLN